MADQTIRRVAKTCAHCGAKYRPGSHWDRRQYCSRSCAYAARPRQHYVDAGRKSAALTAQKRRSSKPLRLQNERQAAYRRGYADGYERALQDMDPSYRRDIEGKHDQG